MLHSSNKLLNKTDWVTVSEDFGRFTGIYNSIKKLLTLDFFLLIKDFKNKK